MITDKNLTLASDQALTATAASEDVIDLTIDRDIGVGEPLWLVLVVKVAAGGTSPTMALSVETDDNSGFSSASTIITFPTLAAADMALGAVHAYPFPLANERYVRGKFTLGGTSPTVTVDLYLTPYEPRNWKAYPDAI